MFCQTDGSMKSKLNPCALGFALGVTKGLCMMLFAWAGYFWGFGVPMIGTVAGVYHGYAPTVMGGLIGGAWGLLGGYIFGLVIGVLYNFCLCHCCCKKSSAS